jgi:putative transposase
VRQQCLFLEVNRSTLYYEAVDDSDEIWLLNLIREICLDHTFFGYRKITAFLRNEYKIFVNKKRVQRLMQCWYKCCIP